MPTYDGTGGIPAEKVDDANGACPPFLLFFRIYHEKDFNEIFGSPPATVQT